MSDYSTDPLAYFSPGRVIRFDTGQGTPTTALTIKEITIHPDWALPSVDQHIDLAIIQVKENSPFPMAELFRDPLALNQEVLTGGFGCRRWGGGEAGLLFGATKKIQALRDKTYETSTQNASSPQHSMGCPGDSGSGTFSIEAGTTPPRLTGVVAGFIDDNWVDIDNSGTIIAIFNPQKSPTGRYMRFADVVGSDGTAVLDWIDSSTR